MRPQFSYANVTSTIALCLAVGGGSAYAGATLARNSVKAEQIATGAVGSSEIRNGSVKLKDLAKEVVGTSGASGAAGAEGLRGPAGPAGPQGPQGPAGADLAFNGVRLGPLKRYDATGTSSTNSTRINLGKIGTVSIDGYCFDPNDSTSGATEVRLRNDAGAAAVPVIGALSNQQVIQPGLTVVVDAWNNADPSVRQWGATILLDGITYDLRGIALRQAPGGANPLLPPAGMACGLTEASIERVTR